jgi:hypothetical protein
MLGQTDIRADPASTDASSFLDRERALLGDDAAQFATPHDLKATTVEEADEDDLLGGGHYDSGADTIQFESSFPDIDTTNEVTIVHTAMPHQKLTIHSKWAQAAA